MLKKILHILMGLGSFFKASLSRQPLSKGFKLLLVTSKY